VLFEIPGLFLAGEGSLKERGLRPLLIFLPVATGRLRGVKPLFISLPLSKQNNQGYPLVYCLERGIKGVRLR
jgi:hypothetical protein